MPKPPLKVHRSVKNREYANIAGRNLIHDPKSVDEDFSDRPTPHLGDDPPTVAEQGK